MHATEHNFSINNDFLCANILEDQAPYCDNTKGLSNLVIINNAEISTVVFHKQKLLNDYLKEYMHNVPIQ